MSARFENTKYDLESAMSLRILCEDAEASALGRAFSTIEPWCRYGMTAEALCGYIACEALHQRRFCIRVADRLAGLVIVQPGWLRGPYVPFLGVLPEFQRGGIGRSVLHFVAETARGERERNTWIAVSEFNARARSLYEQMGYIAIAEIPALVADEHTEILMRKRL